MFIDCTNKQSSILGERRETRACQWCHGGPVLLHAINRYLNIKTKFVICLCFPGFMKVCVVVDDLRCVERLQLVNL